MKVIIEISKEEYEKNNVRGRHVEFCRNVLEAEYEELNPPTWRKPRCVSNSIVELKII